MRLTVLKQKHEEFVQKQSQYNEIKQKQTQDQKNKELEKQKLRNENKSKPTFHEDLAKNIKNKKKSIDGNKSEGPKKPEKDPKKEEGKQPEGEKKGASPRPGEQPARKKQPSPLKMAPTSYPHQAPMQPITEESNHLPSQQSPKVPRIYGGPSEKSPYRPEEGPNSVNDQVRTQKERSPLRKPSPK